MWDAMADYAIQDVENMKEVFFTYYPKLNRTERLKLSWATKNYVQPRLRLDEQVIFNSLINAEVKREKALAAAGIDEKTARSGPKFAAHLKSMGIEVEMKEGKVMEIPALSKDDNFMLQALKGDNTLLKTAVLARLAAMSNIELTRANRLKEMCEAADGMMLTPTNYAAAHTGRNGGYDGVNLLNFPRDSPLRKAIRPPEGYVIVDGDASQIEMRIMAWLARQEDLLDMFRRGIDTYCQYATDVIFHRPITPADERERQMAKVELLSLQYGVGRDTLHKRLFANGIYITI